MSFYGLVPNGAIVFCVCVCVCVCVFSPCVAGRYPMDAIEMMHSICAMAWFYLKGSQQALCKLLSNGCVCCVVTAEVAVDRNVDRRCCVSTVERSLKLEHIQTASDSNAVFN